MVIIVVVVGWVIVYEVIGQDEVDGGIVLVKWCWGGCFGVFKQQQVIVVEGGLQGDFVVVDGCDIVVVEIVDFVVFGEGFVDVDGQRFFVLFWILVDLWCCGVGFFFFQ